MEKGKNSTKEKKTNSPRSPIGLKHSLKSNTHMYVVLCWCYQKLIVSIMNHCLTAAGGLIFPDWSSSLKFGTCTERIYTFPFMCSNIKPAACISYLISLIEDCCFQVMKLKFTPFYGRHQKLVYRYEISVSTMRGERY